MFKIILSTITKGGYKLSEILDKIDIMWITGKLTNEERDNLIEKARTNATPESEYAPLMEQINEAFEQIEALTERVAKLEAGEGGEGGEGGEEPEPTSTEEYPEYVQPTGQHDAYRIGDKITWKGKHYECIRDYCVWNPDDLPQGWKEVTEETTELSEPETEEPEEGQEENPTEEPSEETDGEESSEIPASDIEEATK